MNDNFTIQQLLDDVLLQKVDRTDAEKTLAALGVDNASFEIDTHFAAAKAIQRQKIIEQVQAVHQKFTSAETVTTVPEKAIEKLAPVHPLRWILRVAAAVILMMALFIGYEYTNTSSSQIYSSVYQSYEVNTSRNNAEELPTHQMLEQFKSKDYAAVINTFKTLGVTNNREKFLTAYAFLETQKYTAASNLFKEILQYNQQTNTKLYNDEAEFYAGLSYLKMNNIKTSLQYFEPIAADPDHTFHKRLNKWTLIKLKWLK